MSRLLCPMKPRSPLPLGTPLALTVALLGLAFAGLAAQTKTNAPSRSVPAATNALPLLVPIPQSVFIIPTSPQEGKDPFFPRSMRPFNDVVVRTNQQPAAVVAVELKLNGISGIAGRRLAIINNRTFEIGEEGEVVSNGSRVRIICKDIQADSVRILVSGEERLLRLRPR
jgi:hypothetical protein